MIHLRIVAPSTNAQAVVDCLCACDTVIDIVHLPGVARRPDGDLITCNVAREDASVVFADLRALGIHHSGSITAHYVDVSDSDAAHAAEHAARGAAADAVVWEDVTEHTSESAELSGVSLTFIVLAG